MAVQEMITENKNMNMPVTAPVTYSFERYETKFLLSPEQYRVVMPLMRDRMTEDRYGVYTICNIYYDCDSFDLIRSSLEHPQYKEKFRLRSYGVPGENDKIFAEIKRKYNGVVYKRRIEGESDDILSFLNGSEPAADITGSAQIEKEIRNFFSHWNNPQPKAFIGYERLALAGKDDPDLRITFDWNMRWREDRLDLRDGDDGQLILPDDHVVMEVKSAGAIPLWLTSVLSMNRVYPQGFSKYGTCYSSYLAPEYSEKERSLGYAS